MLTITVEFLNGTFRADPDGTAMTGLLDRGEWPPAPSRLFAALVAADGTRDQCRVTTGAELDYLEALPPPIIYADGDADVHHNVLSPRFIVEAGGTLNHAGRVQEYIGQKAAQIRPGVRVCPRNSTVSYVWPTATPSDVTMAGLKLRAARIGYLGCADSAVRVRLGDVAPQAGFRRFVPDDRGDRVIGVPRLGAVAALDHHFDLLQELGPSLRRSQSQALRTHVRYRFDSPEHEIVPASPSPSVLWFALGTPVSGRRLLAVTETMRRTLLDRVGRLGESIPAVLHGHGIEGVGFDTARFLALPDVGHQRATGRIHGIAIWLPSGTPVEVAALCRRAMAGADELRGNGIATSIAAWSGDPRPKAAQPQRWMRTSRRWATVFPAVHERRVDAVDLAEVQRWCIHAGLPAPVAVRVSRRAFIPGGVELAVTEANRPGKPSRRYSHVDLVFDQFVQGPFAIGAGRQFGLGLCAEVPEVVR